MQTAKKVHKIHNKNKQPYLYLFLGIILAGYLLLLYKAPLRLDDLTWGSSIGLDRLKNGFAGYNGRYLGNLIVIILLRLPLILRISVELLCIVWMLWQAYLLLGRNTRAFCIFTALFLLLPLQVFSQTVTWVSGFANYMVSAVILLFLLQTSFEIVNPERPASIPLWKKILFLLLAFGGQLILETATIYTCLLLLFASFVYKCIHKKLSPILSAAWILSAAGTAVMFSNSAYSAAVTGDTSVTYKEIGAAAEGTGLISRYWKTFSQELIPMWIPKNLALNLVLCMLVFFLWKLSAAKYTRIMQVLSILFMLYFVYDAAGIIGIPAIPSDLRSIVILLYTAYIFLTIFCVMPDKALRLQALFYAASQFFLVGPLLIVKPINYRCFLHSYLFFALLCAVLFMQAAQAVQKYLTQNVPVRQNPVPEALIQKCQRFLPAFFCLLAAAVFAGHILTQWQSWKIEDARMEAVARCIADGGDSLVLPKVPYSSYVCYGANSYGSEYWIQNYKRYYHIPDNVALSFVEYHEWEAMTR